MIDFWHWWVLALALLAYTLLRRQWIWFWPTICASLVGYLVLLQPGMFWHRQWLFFLLPSVILMWLARKR